MKYLITDSEFQPQIVMGHEIGHQDLRKSLIGRVGSAGHFIVENGCVKTYGKSIGLNIEPAERDASLIAAHLGLGYDKVIKEI